MPCVMKYTPYSALGEAIPYLSRRAVKKNSVLRNSGATYACERKKLDDSERKKGGVGLWDDANPDTCKAIFPPWSATILQAVSLITRSRIERTCICQVHELVCSAVAFTFRRPVVAWFYLPCSVVFGSLSSSSWSA
ncbi:hypothetical protein EDC04DRAFT_2217377 [Pisolithus marmoratus]|nr:hypothetical protein EDC04DRAFT_2217377 [Pisolithus marmoratus]